MSAPVLEEVLLDFDGYLAHQDEETRNAVQQQINLVPEGGRAAEKQKIASQFVVGESTGLDSGTVNDKWDTVRGGFAEKQGGEFLGVKDDEAGFHGQLVKRATARRDERYLVEGMDTKDEAGRVSREKGLYERLFRGFALDQSYGDVFAQWQAEASTKPGYDPKRADVYARKAGAFYAEAQARLSPVMPMAKEAFAALSTGADLEATSEDFMGRVSALDNKQRRDFLAAVGIVARANPDSAPTFWTNLEKSASRQVGSMGRGVADLGTAWVQLWKVAAEGEMHGHQSPEFFGSAEEGLQKLSEHNLESDIRRIQETTWSPVKEMWPQGWRQTVERGIYGMPGAAVSSGVAIVPYVGVPATLGMMASDAYETERFRLLDTGQFSDSGASIRAFTMAPYIAAPQAVLEKIGADAALLGKLPYFKGAMTALGNRFASGAVSKFAVRAAGGALAETATEQAQDLMNPIVETAAAALEKDMPEVQWRGKGGVMDGWWSQWPETFVTMLPLALVGAASHPHVDAMNAASDVQLKAFGASDADISAVRKGDEAAVEHILTNRDPNSDEAKAATVELRDTEKARMKQIAEHDTAANRAAGVSHIVRNEDGWKIEREDGTAIQVGTAEAARSIRDDLLQASTQKEADAMVALADDFQNKAPGGEKRETKFTGQVAQASGDKTTRTRPGSDAITEVTSAQDLDTMREQAGSDAISALVLGSNTVEFREKIGADAAHFMQSLEINQGGDALTQIHERAEAVWKTAIAKGTITADETQRAVASVASHLDPANARDDAERAFRERVQRVASGEASAAEVRETVSELTVANVIGRRKDGQTLPAGSITAITDAALKNATSAADVQSIGKFRAMLNAARQYFRGLFGTVAALKKAKSKDFEAFVNKLLEIDPQPIHDRISAEAALSMVGDKTFRLEPTETLNLVQKHIEQTLDKNPEKRREMVRSAIEKLEKKRHEMNAGEPIVEKRTVAELDKEQAAHQAFVADDLMRKGTDEKQARKQAREAATKWRTEQDAKQKRDWNPRAAQARDAQVFNALLSVFPEKIRAKANAAFVKLAQLGEKGRQHELIEQIDRLGSATEKYLRKEYQTAIAELFDKAQPKGGSGDKALGKLGAAGHGWFAEAERISTLSETALEAEEALVESKLNGSSEITAADIVEMNRRFDGVTDEDGALAAFEVQETLLQNFGDLKNRSAEELASAHDLMKSVFKGERAVWRAAMEARIEARKALREQATIDATRDAGGLAIDDAIAVRQGKDQTLLGQATDFLDTSLSWEGALSDATHHNSATHRWAEVTKRKAENAERDAMDRRQAEFQEFTKTLWPGSRILARQKKLEELQRRKEVSAAGQTRIISELEMVTYTLQFRDPDSRTWLSNHGYGEQAISDFEKLLSDDAKAIRSWLAEHYDGQYDYINAVYKRTRGVNLPRVRNYAPRLVDHGGDIADMALTPEAMGGALNAGFNKRRVRVPTKPPLRIDALTSYWQNAHQVEHWVAWAESLGDLRAVLQHTDTLRAIKAGAGEQAAKNIVEWMQTFNRGGIENARGQALWRRVLRSFADNALLLKVGVLLKQAPAAFSSAADIGMRNWMRSASKVVTGKGAISLSDMLHSPTIQRRMSQYPIEMRQAMQGADGVLGKVSSLFAKVGVDPRGFSLAMEYARGQIGAMDAIFTTFGAAVSYDHHFKEARASGLNEEDAHAFAAEQADLTVSRTAQPENFATKSLFENRLGSVGAPLFMFQSANRQAFAATYLAFKQSGFKTVEGRQRLQDWARDVAVYWVVTGAALQTIGNLVRYATSDDDWEDEWSLSDYGRSMAMGPLTGALWLGPVMDAVVTAFSGGYTPRVISPSVEIAKLIRAVKSDGDFDARRIGSLTQGLSEVLGGNWAILGVTWNVLRQMLGLSDALTPGDQETVTAAKKSE